MAMATSRPYEFSHGSSPEGEHDAHSARDKAFRRAQSHSRRVRLLKIALPTIGALIAVAFTAYSYISAPVAVALDVASSIISDGKLIMANPKLDGFTKENLPYSMSAARAIQSLDQTGSIELQEISARLPVDAESWAELKASKGIFDRDKNTLDLTSDIVVKTTDGKEIRLKSASIDITKGDVKTADPVDVVLDGTKIAADSMTVLENGKILVFEKRVKIEIDPRKLKAGQRPDGDLNVAN